MKKMNSLKAAAVYMMVAFVGMFMSVFVSCKPDEVTGHDNNGNAAMSITVKPDTTKPGPQPVLGDTIYWHFRGDSLVVICDSLKDNVIFKSDSTAIGYTLEVKREFDERQTASTRLEYPNLGFTFADAINKQNGKMEYVGSQTGSDDDGQSYTINLTSGKIVNWHGLNVHFVLNGTKLNRFDNKELTPKANESTRVESTMKWEPELGVAGLKNPDGKTMIAKRETKHDRFILKNAPELIGHKNWKVWKETGNWNTLWHFSCEEIWSNDSVAPKSKMTTLKGTYSRKDLDDKTVSGFDYTHPAGDLKWGDYAEIESKDAGVKLFEKKGTKKAYATNGFDADKFDTEFTVTMQKADVMFCDSLFHVESDEATLTNERNVFVEEASDRDGYSMLRFTDTEVAKWNGEYAQKLDESCKLYLKLAEPEIIDYILVDGSDYKTRTENSVKVGLTIKPKYKDGTFGKEIPFKMERAESWTWLKDSVIYEGIEFFMQETAEKLELVGDLKKTAKTQKDNGGVFSFNEYEADFRATVKSNGMTKYTSWHATWSEDFTFTYTDENGKSFKHTFDKSNYDVKAQNDQLKKNESKSSVTSEVYDYSVDGIFAIDNVNRSAYGYGRFQKTIDDVVINEYWEKFSFDTDAHEYTDRVEYYLKWIKEYSTGKKTSTDVKVILMRDADGSTYTVTVDDPQRTIGSQSENSSYIARTESADDVTIYYDWKTTMVEIPNYFDGSTIIESDVATFVDPTNVRVTKKNSKGEDVEISLPSFEHTLTSTVSDLQKVSESDELVEYTYTRSWSWASNQCTSTVQSIGNINKIPEGGGGEPDFDIEVGQIYATVSRPSNRNGNPITAYTYLLVSKDGTKCLPIGIYKDVVTEGKIQDMHSTYNSACYVKDANEVVPTNCYSHNGLGMMIWADKDGNPVDAETHTWLQGNRFNDRGNDYVNHTGKYAPKAEKKGNVYVVTFEGTNASYTFRGWDVK